MALPPPHPAVGIVADQAELSYLAKQSRFTPYQTIHPIATRLHIDTFIRQKSAALPVFNLKAIKQQARNSNPA
jgi:hypothetical protein